MRWWLCVPLLVALLQTTPGLAQSNQQCPAQDSIAPCICAQKKNGLDILCEFTDLHSIQKAMVALKTKPTIIFYLKLRHNRLAKLPGFIFLGLDIRHLNVHNSTLSVIEETSLSSIGKGLTQLDVSQNSLAIVPSAAFTHLNHLLILNMNHNKVTKLHDNAFEGLDTLEILTLYENKISVVEPLAFKGLGKKLKRLNLGCNQLDSVPQRALSLLENLKKLEMQENNITKIRTGDFAGLHNLDSLGLAHNKLKEVPAEVFSHLNQLNSLELEGNEIGRVDERAFAGLEANLQYLRLGDNHLQDIPSDALRALHRLRYLDLRSNNITSISEDAFSGFGDSITFLNLQKNSIYQLPAMGFENLNSLETLNLQNNKITLIPEEIMEPLTDTLRFVDITDNPLICQCDLSWYAAWLFNLRDKDDEMIAKKRPARCTMPSEHREYEVAHMPFDSMNCKRKININTSAALSRARSTTVVFNVVPLLVVRWL